MPGWLVGGVVRDALLGRPTRDVDLVVEGDAIVAARRLAGASAAEVTTHPAFGTATVRLPGGVVDVAAARAEQYPSPGSLPVVRPADIDADLRRRDFALNAMAVGLAGRRLGELVDPLGGRADLAHRRLRVLHDASFRDDPTRILRGARYAARLGFVWEVATEEQARAAIAAGLLLAVGRDRLRDELLLLLDEPGAAAALARLNDLGALPSVVPGVDLDPATRDALTAATILAERHQPDARLAAVRLGLLVGALPAGAREQAVAELRLARADARIVAAVAAADVHARALVTGGPDATDEVLGRLPPEAALAVAARGDERAAARATEWLRRIRHVRLEVGGDDLQRELGLRPSPGLGAVLAELRRLKIRGELPDRQAELDAARRLVARDAVTGPTD